MPDAPDPDSSSDSSSSESDRTPYVQQWQALCEVLGTSDPNEVLARVQTLKRRLERSDAADADREEESLVTISEVEDVFRDMNEKIEKLRQRNADLARKLEERDGEGQPQKAEQLLEVLDAATMEEAEQRVRQLSERLEALYREKETLAQAGLPDAEDALEEIDRLRREREALRRERDELQSERDELAEKLEAASDQTEDASSGAPTGLPPEAADVLGIRSVEEAYELEALIDDLSERLERLRHEHEELEAAGLSVETALTMIENMEAQLASLYHSDAEERRSPSGGPPADTAPAALDDALRHRIEALTDTSPEAADDLTDLMRPLVDRLETLSDTHEALVEADLDGEKAVAIIESMEAQLNDLYRRIDEQGTAADRLDAIEEVLGISTRREAEELSELAQQMEQQLTSLYGEKEKLRELGLSSIEDAVDMIESMEAQLDDLYEDKEALRDVELEDTEEQSTFQQLEALYAERQRLQETLGVSSADDVIEMVETLTSQLEDLYTGRDAAVDPKERHDAQLWAPDTGNAPEAAEPDSEEDASPLTIRSLEHQLEALYREKETLLQEGLADAEEAVTRLRTQRRHIDRLQRENADYEQRFDRLASALGTEQVARIVELVRALESETDVTIEEVRPASPDAAPESPAPESPVPDARLEATSPVVDDRTLARLDDMSDGELNALDVGALGLRDDGTVTTLNDTALRLPPLRTADAPDDVLGHHFFRDLAPSTNNALFAGRFHTSGRRGTLDARFPYTFARADAAPESFAVHLYRAPESDTTWLLVRPL